MLLRLFLFFISWSISAQKIDLTKDLSEKEADSLRQTGYYAEELRLRKSLLSKTDPGSRKNYTLAKINFLLDESLHEDALKEYQKLSGNLNEDNIWIIKLKARLFNYEEKYAESIRFLKSLKKRQSPVEEAIVALELGHAYSETANWPEAVKSLETAHRLFEKNGMSKHYLNALALNDLAFAYDEAGIHNKVLNYYDNALNIFTHYYSSDYRKIATIHNNIIFSYTDYGDKKKAAEIQKRFEAYMEEFISGKSKKTYRTYSATERLDAVSMYFLSNCRYYSFMFDKQGIYKNIHRMEELFKKAPEAWRDANYPLLKSAYDSGQYGLRKNGYFEESIL